MCIWFQDLLREDTKCLMLSFCWVNLEQVNWQILVSMSISRSIPYPAYQTLNCSKLTMQSSTENHSHMWRIFITFLRSLFQSIFSQIFTIWLLYSLIIDNFFKKTNVTINKWKSFLYKQRHKIWIIPALRIFFSIAGF